jgi:hypothetical protein
MNLCIRGYLNLVDDGNSIKYSVDDEDQYFEGNFEEYINKLEFKEGQEFDLDEEWDKFCNEFFNDGNNFYREVEDWADFSCQFNSKEMIYLIKMVNDYWLETTGEPFDLAEADEEKIWNCIAYAWIRVRSDNIKFFVLEKIQEKFNEWLEEQKEEEGKHRLTCDICYENKPIETYASCCNDKKFCERCYKKIKKDEDGIKVCPYCRGNLDHDCGEEEICKQTDFQEWLSKMFCVFTRIRNKVISNCVKCNVEIGYKCWVRIKGDDFVCKKCFETKPVPEKKKIVRRDCRQQGLVIN